MSLRNVPTLKSSRIKVGITIGDPSGIGPAITLKSIYRLKGLARFVVIADAWVVRQIKDLRFKSEDCEFIDLNNVRHKGFTFGKVKAEYGRASIEYLDKALELIKTKQIDCLVTCPISKEAVNKAGLPGFSGHTEYLAKHTGTKGFAMILLNKDLKICLITRHIALRDAALQINKGNICKTIDLAYNSLKKLFRIKEPRIVVCGLNPHASDNGLIGDEENTIIKPAIKSLQGKIMYLKGPISADVAVSRAYQQEYDCVIAMYHDQALIPLKMVSPDTGVNLTAGLPFVRTSPLHGTAFDVAGRPSKANPNSLIEAIKTAIRCASNLKKD